MSDLSNFSRPPHLFRPPSSRTLFRPSARFSTSATPSRAAQLFNALAQSMNNLPPLTTQPWLMAILNQYRQQEKLLLSGARALAAGWNWRVQVFGSLMLLISLAARLLAPGYSVATLHHTWLAASQATSRTLIQPYGPQPPAQAAAPASPVAGVSPELSNAFDNLADGIIANARAERYDENDTFVGDTPAPTDGSWQSLPAGVALFEKYRPADNWRQDILIKDDLSEIYADDNQYWKDERGQVKKIEDGFVITRIPKDLAPIYEIVEEATGVSRYILMAVATIESKQGLSFLSPTNCQGYGHFCPGTIRLFQGKNLLPPDFDPYDPYDGIMGIAVHLRVSSMGTTNYAETIGHLTRGEDIPWPPFWNGEVPSFSAFESHSRAHPIIQAAWGYNRSSFYGFSVASLARFYMDHDR